MIKNRNSSLVTLALMLSVATTGEIIKPLEGIQPVFAQDTPVFVIPDNVPEDLIVRIDGDTAMEQVNEEFKNDFESQYPGAQVQIEYSDSQAALEALDRGDIDLAALGRELTEEEKAQGYQQVNLDRFKKIAIIIGSENPFDGDLTDEQFAQIFRGEITNWSEVGGPDVPIRFIDRAEEDDTREALSKYPVFTEQEFTSSPAEVVPVDATLEQIAEKLGDDGISYGIAERADEITNIKIVPMSGVLPDDPRYPFSQPLTYVYKDQPSEAAALFLGFLVGETPPEPVDEAIVEETPAETVEETVEEIPEAIVEEPVEETPTPAPAPAPEAQGGFPWWLLLIPIIGGLLWWLLGRKKDEPEAVVEAVAPTPAVVPPVVPPIVENSRIILVPRDCKQAYAYWEIPSTRQERIREDGGRDLQLRIYEITPTGTENLISQLECDRQEPDLHVSIPKDNRNYVAELGYKNADSNWISLARSESVLVPACSRIILVPRNCKQAYAYWEVPQEHLDASKQLKLRLYDVTNQEVHAGELMSEADCDYQAQDLHIDIPVDDRDYVADLGYTNAEGNWFSITRSEAVHVPACPKETAGEMFSVTDTDPIGFGEMVSATEVISEESNNELDFSDDVPQNRLILVPRSCREAYAYWELSDSLKPSATEQLLLRLYDVTDKDIDAQESEEILELPCSPDLQDYHVPIPLDNRDYLVELGYVTPEGNWFCLARSEAVRVPVCPPVETPEYLEASQMVGDEFEVNSHNGIQPPILTPPDEVTNSEITLLPRSCREAYAYWTISKIAQEAYQAQGGQILALRLYDVTSIDTDEEIAYSMHQFDCTETDTEYYLPIPVDNRDYIIEIGYITEAGGWLRLARSQPVHIPACPVDDPQVSKVTLVPQDNQNADVTWELTLADQQISSAKLRLYDVNIAGTELVKEMDCELTNQKVHITIPVSDRDYLVELGYYNEQGDWVSIAKSTPVSLPSQV
ncbi:MAG: DUF4912 domain-containing protein [Gloeocapsa sp. DLM2.Bin57]|nr:MAG: DUF4912 domain-containing protein [Gloeocapsa sp. DLM2.Bin57]